MRCCSTRTPCATTSNATENGGVDELLRMNYVGSEALLDASEMKELDAHLQEHLYDTAQAVARYVERC